MQRRSSRQWCGFVLTCLLSAPFARAQQQTPDDLKKDIEALQKTVTAIQKDVQEIKALLQSRQPAAPQQVVDLDLSRSPFKGDRNAKLTLVEFSDYQ